MTFFYYNIYVRRMYIVLTSDLNGVKCHLAVLQTINTPMCLYWICWTLSVLILTTGLSWKDWWNYKFHQRETGALNKNKCTYKTKKNHTCIDNCGNILYLLCVCHGLIVDVIININPYAQAKRLDWQIEQVIDIVRKTDV